MAMQFLEGRKCVIFFACCVLLLISTQQLTAEAGRPRRRRNKNRHASSPARSATGLLKNDRLDFFVPVTYHSLARTRQQDRNKYRKLDDNNASESWLTWEDAKAQNETGPLRVQFVKFYSGSTDLMIAAEHCVREGQKVQQNKMIDDGVGNIAGSGDELECTADEVVSNETLIASIVDLRLDWVVQYMMDTFTVKQAQRGITLDSSTMENYPFDGNPSGPVDSNGDLLCNTTLAGECPNSTYPNADLVIVVTLHPLSRDKSGIAGYASCQQSDQYGRCTVGYFEWVPSTLTPATYIYNDVIMNERATALHECMHVLGGIKNSQLFRNAATGTALLNRDKILIADESEYIGKQVAIWITPGVRDMAREQFNCSEISGVPLEDLPSGANGHWESRLMGSEVMSYGLSTGEYYVSQLTLKFFEDSNQYIVNYTAGTQRFVEATPSDNQLASDIFSNLFSEKAEEGYNQSNRSWGSGYQRWGRNQGCDFFWRRPSAENWTERYFCTEVSGNGCTADRILSGICTLYEYGSGDDDVAASETWYAQSSATDSWYNSSSAYEIDIEIENIDNAQYPGLPSEYQYLGNYLESSYGGFLAAMDYAPVVTGQINCQDDEPSPGTLAFSIDEIEYTGSIDDWVDFQDEIAGYGGQIYSDRSRCFLSSLLLLSESYVAVTDTSVLTKAGLCYLSNCYTEDYLQIGVKTTLGGTKWFRCEEASTVYVAGYVGSFTCPDPNEFCSYEDVTGVRYTENNELLEWVFWICLFGIALITFLVFIFSRKVRQCVSKKLKELMNHDLDYKPPKLREKSSACKALAAISTIWIFIGLGFILIAITSILNADGDFLWDGAAGLVWWFAGFGVLMIVLATLGVMAADGDGPTLKATFYLYINMFLIIVFLVLSVIVLGVPTWLNVIVDVIWNGLYTYFPSDWQTLSSEEAWDKIETWYTGEGTWIVALIIGWNAFSMIGGMICAFIMLTFRNVLGTMLFWMNCVLFIAGVAFVVACYVLSPVLPNLGWRSGLFLAGSLTIVSGTVGFFTCRQQKVIILWVSFTSITFITMLTVGIFLIVNVDVNSDHIRNLTEAQLGEVLLNLEFIAIDWTKEELVDFFDANIYAAAAAQLLLAFVILATMGAALLVLKDIHDQTQKNKPKQAKEEFQTATVINLSTNNQKWMKAEFTETRSYNELLKTRSEQSLSELSGIELQVFNEQENGDDLEVTEPLRVARVID
jgi:hypothetical protein